jgi:hypothetical protein
MICTKLLFQNEKEKSKDPNIPPSPKVRLESGSNTKHVHSSQL